MRVISWRLVVVIVVGVVALASSPVVSTLVLIGCIGAAFVGPVRGLQALMIATLVTYANPGIIKIAASSGVLLRVVFLAAVLRVLLTIRGSDVRLVWPVWVFALVSALCSMATSPALDISIMKVITFALAATAVPVAYNHLTPRELQKMQSWVLTVGVTVIGLSALTLLKPALGAGANGGLQGLLNQPQALGIFIAPFAAWSIAGVLLMQRRASRLELWMAIGMLVLILLTRARTAAFATFFGVGIALVARLLSRRTPQQAPLGRPLVLGSLAVAALAVMLATTAQFSSMATEFAFKGTQRENRDLSAAFYDSRGGGVVAQWHHFKQQPLFGNGFGVYPDGKFRSGVVRFAGIPISAPVEKGFLPTAVLEEGGIPGAVTLALLIFWLGRHAWRNADLRWRAMFVACLGMNIGECVFLSPGGIGMFDWLLLSLALVSYRAVPTAASTRASTAEPLTLEPADAGEKPLAPVVT